VWRGGGGEAIDLQAISCLCVSTEGGDKEERKKMERGGGLFWKCIQYSPQKRGDLRKKKGGKTFLSPYLSTHVNPLVPQPYPDKYQEGGKEIQCPLSHTKKGMWGGRSRGGKKKKGRGGVWVRFSPFFYLFPSLKVNTNGCIEWGGRKTKKGKKRKKKITPLDKVS